MPLRHLERYNTSPNLRRRLGSRAERDFLELNSMTVSGLEDDFQGDTLLGTYQSTASGTSSAAAAISTGVVNGAILLDAGTDNSGRCDLSWGRHYQGQLNPVYVARLSINTLTTRKFEVMFTDVISGTDAGAVATKATPTFNATDSVGLVFDSNDDTLLTLVGNANGTAATVADFSIALEAATYYYFGVALIGTGAHGFVLDANGYLLEKQEITAAVTTDVLLTPWLFVQNRGASAGTMTVDWHRAYQRRTTTD